MIFLSFFIVKKYSSKVKNFNLKKTLKVLNRKKFNFNFFKYLQYTFFFKIFKKIFDVKLKFYKILPFLLGFNKSVCNNLILNFGFTKNSRLYNLSEVEFFFFFKKFFKKSFCEDKLKIFFSNILQNFLVIGNSKGQRLKQKLPMRGQRTKSNGKTCKKFLHALLFSKYLKGLDLNINIEGFSLSKKDLKKFKVKKKQIKKKKK